MRMVCRTGHQWVTHAFVNGADYQECSFCGEIRIVEDDETPESILDKLDEAWESFEDEHDPDVQRDLARDREWEETRGLD